MRKVGLIGSMIDQALPFNRPTTLGVGLGIGITVTFCLLFCTYLIRKIDVEVRAIHLAAEYWLIFLSYLILFIKWVYHINIGLWRLAYTQYVIQVFVFFTDYS